MIQGIIHLLDPTLEDVMDKLLAESHCMVISKQKEALEVHLQRHFSG